MRLPRIRLTTRRMMVAVAAGAALSLWMRSIEYERMGWHYRRRGVLLSRCGSQGGRPFIALADQCARVARYPWLAVDPNPPLPERVVKLPSFDRALPPLSEAE